MTLDELNALPRESAADAFRACCGSSRWVDAMIARRPFASADALYSIADAIWWSLDAADWREAFSHHPRIGDRSATGWASTEQRGAGSATADTRAQLAEANAQYERRFGYIYIVCATGKSAEEMLAIARARLENDPDAEVRVAAEEQRKITRLRLEKLLTENDS